MRKFQRFFSANYKRKAPIPPNCSCFPTTYNHFPLSTFDPSTSFQACTFPLNPLSNTHPMPNINIKQLFWAAYLISLDNASSTMASNRGLNNEASCNPTWTMKSSLKEPSHQTQLWAFLYNDCTNLPKNSSIVFLKPIKQHPYELCKPTNRK